MLHVIAREGDRVTAELPEDVDLYTTPALRAVVHRLIDEGCRRLVLDASRTVHLDSTGVSALVAWFHRLDGQGGTLVVTGLSEALHRMLTILGLDTVMALTPGPASSP
ncbi:STAS domain-containing protein [Streptomyces sp. NPDC052701]|uniref:STAS domain-containing protein n=1 Tax=Streptomyces sp. NPDC052701 TaxID=3155533 RepID=UPI0034369391